MKRSVLDQHDVTENVSDDREATGSSITTLITMLILSILTLILVSLVSFIYYIINQDVIYNIPSVSNMRIEEIDVLCDDLSLSPAEDEETFNPGTSRLSVSVNSEEKYVCKSKNVGELVNMVIERNLRIRQAKGKEEDPYLSCGNRSLAPKSGHLTKSFSQISRNEIENDIDTETVLHWEHQNKTENSSGDEIHTYNDAEITVQTGQTYVIYASVHVNISRQSLQNQQNKFRRRIFKLRVCKDLHGYEQTLLGETKIFPNDLDTDIVSSVKVMGHLHLNKKDIIYVKVTNADYVIPQSKGNTFGIFPI